VKPFTGLPTGSKLPVKEIAASSRHLFLCTGPDCCDPTEGLELWERLKRRCRDLGLPVLRSKAACLRICRGGPWLVVYPEGIWYGNVSPERLERILLEHIQNGNPIHEWTAAITGRETLPSGNNSPNSSSPPSIP
jgi:(2Fe-2S) ferredoxin